MELDDNAGLRPSFSISNLLTLYRDIFVVLLSFLFIFLNFYRLSFLTSTIIFIIFLLLSSLRLQLMQNRSLAS